MSLHKDAGPMSLPHSSMASSMITWLKSDQTLTRRFRLIDVMYTLLIDSVFEDILKLCSRLGVEWDC